jgi:dihydrodipicolinate synthase/N-acetylneuraminate lyase
LIYNIPYRRGVNLGNDAMLQLAEHANIVGSRIARRIRRNLLTFCAAGRPALQY